MTIFCFTSFYISINYYNYTDVLMQNAILQEDYKYEPKGIQKLFGHVVDILQ